MAINNDKNMGEIGLAVSTQQLKEVVIRGNEVSRPISTNMEGLIIRPDQTISNVGGTVLDVLRNTPSVDVNDDGTISLRGSDGTNILIDGRNSALGTDLFQLPASAIESIQIVNNPNSKYDAQSAGGIINIKLKRGEDMGSKGGAELTVGTRYRLNSSLRMSHRTAKYGIYGGYSYGRWPRVGSSSTIRQSFGEGERLEQNDNSESMDNEHTLNLGGDYYFGKNKISYEGAFNTEKEVDTETIHSRLLNAQTDDLILQYTRDNTNEEDNYAFDNAIIYERAFADTVKEFRILASHSFRDQFENQYINVYSGMANEGEITGRERSFTDELRHTAILQADYVQPLWGGRLDMGYKLTFRSFDNDYVYEVQDQNSGSFVDQPTIINRFLYQDQVHAGYLLYNYNFNKFNVSAGTRVEQTMVSSKLYNTGEENDQSYLDFFPSLQALYNMDDRHALKFTYSRRIDRPSAWRLNPFPDFSDSLNVRLGNPDLDPEYIQSFEVGHLINFDRANITYNFSYRHVNGQLDWIVRLEDGISYRQPSNLLSSTTYGLEFINMTEIMPWWNVNASFSIFQSEVDGSNIDSNFTKGCIVEHQVYFRF